MASARKKKAPKIPKVPIHGKVAHNAAFLVSIGNLVVNWANSESVFMAMLQTLLSGGKQSAAIVWFSHRTTVARLELVSRLCREQVRDTKLLEDIARAISAFKTFSRARNFYCHATYRYDSELNLLSASGVTATQDADPIVFEDKKMNLATLNEISFTTTELGKFNRELWKLVDRLQTELGVQRVNLPQLRPELK